jgi:hypothetical protein
MIAPPAGPNIEHKPPLPAPSRWAHRLELFGLAGLAALVLFFLAVSWRRWPDPLIDFGQQLYVPWRLAKGAVLYRDMEFSYGPLSQYFNAALFACFGPGIMVLVAANVAVFTAILSLLYYLLRRAWGPWAALAASSIFVAVFGFSQYVGIANYNYATPYSHETTHGLLVCLVLVVALLRWMERPTPLRSALAGLLFGLTVVLKPEMLLAAGAITVTSTALSWWNGRRLSLPSIAAWAAGAILPTAGFAVYFSAYLPWRSALARASWAWMVVVSTNRFTDTALQKGFLGFDEPWDNLLTHAEATLLAVLLLAGIATAAWLAKRKSIDWIAYPLAGLVLWLACYQIVWKEVGQCLMGLLLLYLGLCLVTVIRRPSSNLPALVPRLLLAVLAAALMTRMLLHGRVYQFGFYQAALAGVLLPAALIGELPERLRLGSWEKKVAVALVLMLLTPAVIDLSGQSIHILRLKNQEVGEGVDRFYAFPSKINPIGEIVGWIAGQLARQPPGRTLLVLPEGQMINYLTRLRTPTRAFVFYGGDMQGGREEEAVREVRREAPDWVVLISRDLREYGIERFGERPGAGQSILQWVNDHYEKSQSIGRDPLDYRLNGGAILKPKGEKPARPN